MSYARTVNFTTTEANQDILNIPAVRDVMKLVTRADNDMEFDLMRRNGIYMRADVFISNTQVSVNGQGYNDLIENLYYSTEEMLKVYSLRVKDSGMSGTLNFLIGMGEK